MTIFEWLLIFSLAVLWAPYLAFLWTTVHGWITTEYTIMDDLGIAVIAFATGMALSIITWVIVSALMGVN